MASKVEGRKRRKLRIRKKVKGRPDRPRLSVFRSARHIYAQIVDDTTGRTLVSASTLCEELRAGGAGGDDPPPDEQGDDKGKAVPPGGGKMRVARQVGTLLAERCKAHDIGQVVFDRNGYLYHGRVRALAEAVRKGGLDF